MIDIEQRIIDLKISIPNPPSPVGNYVAYKHCDSTIYISGQLPIDENGNMIKGKIGKDLTLEDGKKAARYAILNVIGHLKKSVMNLNYVKQCVKINGFINSTEDFTDHAVLLNAASDLLVEIFGEKGKHARAVIGVSSLPLNAAVEIETIFEVSK
ncbi:RidA family protein [Pelagibacteraceae bacterium]|nr:RidA family protein [Pelagibacteraceae bacterium]